MEEIKMTKTRLFVIIGAVVLLLWFSIWFLLIKPADRNPEENVRLFTKILTNVMQSEKEEFARFYTETIDYGLERPRYRLSEDETAKVSTILALWTNIKEQTEQINLLGRSQHVTNSEDIQLQIDQLKNSRNEKVSQVKSILKDLIISNSKEIALKV